MKYRKKKEYKMTSQAEYEYEYENPTLGQVLKQARIAQGLTISQLSQEAGIAVGQVHKLENDQVKKVNPAHLVAVSGPLEEPVHRLFRLAGYAAEQVPLLEPELTSRLAELSPQALEQITAMLHDWLSEPGMALRTLPEAIKTDEPADVDSNANT